MQVDYEMLYGILLVLFEWFIRLGTLISFLVAIFSLREIKAQRENSMMPDIHIEMKTSKIILESALNNSNYWMPYRWSTDLSGKEVGFNSYLYDVKLVNIGFGSARNVNVKWDFDRNLFADILKKGGKGEYCVINTLGHTNQWDFMSKNSRAVLFDHEDEYKFNYIPSLGVDSNGQVISIPTLFQALYSVCIYNLANERISNNDEESGCQILRMEPTLELSISYEDIAGKKYTKKQVMSFHINMFSRELCQLGVELKNLQAPQKNTRIEKHGTSAL